MDAMEKTNFPSYIKEKGNFQKYDSLLNEEIKKIKKEIKHLAIKLDKEAEAEFVISSIVDHYINKINQKNEEIGNAKGIVLSVGMEKYSVFQSILIEVYSYYLKLSEEYNLKKDSLKEITILKEIKEDKAPIQETLE